MRSSRRCGRSGRTVTVGAVEEVAGHVLVTGRVYAGARATSLVADDPVAAPWRVVDGRVA